MLYAIHDGPMTIVAAADSLVEMEAFEATASLDGGLVDHRRPDPFEMLGDDRYRGLRVPPLVFEFADNDARDAFAARHGLTLLKQNALIDKHADMLVAQEQDPYSNDFDDKRKIGEIHGLDQNDPWDKRSDEQKAQDEQMKKLYDEAKKAGALSGDSFAPPKDPSVRITDIHSTEHADGTVTIDNVLAVKGLHEDTVKEIEEAEAAARAKHQGRALDKVTVDPKNGSWSIDTSGCVGPNGELDIGAFADLTGRILQETMQAEAQADEGEEDDGTTAEPNTPAAYLFHAQNTVNPFDPRARVTLVIISERETFERTGELSEGDLPFALPKGFKQENKPFYVYDGSEETARALLEHVGLKQTRAFREMCKGLIASAGGDESRAAGYLFHVVQTSTELFDNEVMVFIAEAKAFENFSEDDDDLDELLGTDLSGILTPSLYDGFKPYERFYLYEGDPATAASVLDYIGMKQTQAFAAFCEQIIEDGEIDEWSSKSPDDYIFHVSLGDDPYGGDKTVTNVILTPERYFEQEGYLYDQHLAVVLPNGFDCALEGQYTYAGTVEAARAALLSAGFRESAKMSRFLTAREDEDADDDETYEPSEDPRDYLFHAMPNPDEHMKAALGGETLVCIVEESYFKQHGGIASIHVSEVLDLPEEFEEMQEADFLFDGTVEEARAILLGLGLKESEDLKAFFADLGVAAQEPAPSMPGYDPKLMAVVRGIDQRTGGLLGVPQPVVARDPAWQPFTIEVTGDDGDFFDERFLSAAGVIPLNPIVGDEERRVDWLGETNDGFRFTFWGLEREAQRLMAVIHSVTDLPVAATRADGTPMALDLAVAQHIDPDGPVAIYFRVDLAPTPFIEDEEMFVSALRDAKCEDKIAARGATPDGWWVAFAREFDAEQFCKDIDGIFAHLTQPYEMYGVNDKGERLVPKGAATVIDPARLKGEEPRPWNDRASELDAMDEEARAANRKGMKGEEFIFCGSYQGAQHGCVINVTPKSWFERHGTMWEGPLDIAHLLPQDMKEVAPGLYATKSRDWNNLSHDLARRGFKENLFFQLYLNSL